MRPRHLIFVVALFALPSAALAQPAQPTIPPPPYQSPQRDSCDAELARDAVWTAELRQRFINEFHTDESRISVANQKHVYLAYGALWVLTAGFLGLMFLRQQKLVGEIARLEADIKKAVAS